jgi:hypothetical protein
LHLKKSELELLPLKTLQMAQGLRGR